MRIRTGVIRSATAMLVAVFAMVMMVLPAVAQTEYPAEGPTGEASGPSTVEPGSTPTFQGDGFDEGAEVFVSITGVLSATATVTANEQGVASYTVTVPCDTRAGDAQISFSGPGADSGTNTVGMTFTVTEDSEVCVAGDDDAAGAPEPDEGLAATGGEITTGLGIAAVVLLAGAAMVVTTRNRRNESVDA